jgi:hypothetical protein
MSSTKEDFLSLKKALLFFKHLKLVEEASAKHTLREQQLIRTKEDKEKRLEFLQHADRDILKKIALTDKEVQEAEQWIQQKKSQENLMTSQAQFHSYEKERLLKEQHLSELETLFFSLSEQEEQYSIEIQEIQTFLKGFEESSKELFAEIQTDLKNEASKKELILQNIQDCEQQTDPIVWQRFKQAQKKRPQTLDWLTYLNPQGQCSVCRFQVDQQIKRALEYSTPLESCQSCERVFIPACAEAE